MAYVLIFLLSAETAFSADDSKPKILVTCPQNVELVPLIRYCTDNQVAQEFASQCHSKILNMWKSAQTELAALFNINKASSLAAQKSQIANNGQDLKVLLKKLDNLIETSKVAADTIFLYQTVLMNDPTAASIDASKPCFKDPFYQIKNSVIDLDKKIKEGVVARNEAAKLLGITALNFTHIASEQQSTVLKRVEGTKAKNARGVTVSGSTITENSKNLKRMAAPSANSPSKEEEILGHGFNTAPTPSQPFK